jgi:hypothetical protein
MAPEQRRGDPEDERTDPFALAVLARRVGRGMSWDEVSAVLCDAGDTASVEALRKRFERLERKLAGHARAHGLVG